MPPVEPHGWEGVGSRPGRGVRSAQVALTVLQSVFYGRGNYWSPVGLERGEGVGGRMEDGEGGQRVERVWIVWGIGQKMRGCGCLKEVLFCFFFVLIHGSAMLLARRLSFYDI